MSARKAEKRQSWIEGSGAAFHLVRKSDLPISVQRQMRKAQHPVILLSANGEVAESGRIGLRTEKLTKGYESIVLEERPNVLSLGKLIVGGRVQLSLES